jgi:predicted nucleic acid-binding protein
VIVADASAYLELLLDESPDPVSRNLDDDLAAPELLFAEIASGLARAVRQGVISDEHAAFLLEEALTAPIHLTSMRELVSRAFELRSNLSVYDACYVALAEQLGCGIVTADQRLASSPGLTVPVTIV